MDQKGLGEPAGIPLAADHSQNRIEQANPDLDGDKRRNGVGQNQQHPQETLHGDIGTVHGQRQEHAQDEGLQHAQNGPDERPDEDPGEWSAEGRIGQDLAEVRHTDNHREARGDDRAVVRCEDTFLVDVHLAGLLINHGVLRRIEDVLLLRLPGFNAAGDLSARFFGAEGYTLVGGHKQKPLVVGLDRVPVQTGWDTIRHQARGPQHPRRAPIPDREQPDRPSPVAGSITQIAAVPSSAWRGVQFNVGAPSGT